MNRIPKKEIFELLSGLKGDVGLYIHLLDTDELLQIDPDRVFPSASVIKIPILALLLKDIQAGQFSWSQRVPIAPENRVGGTGILFALDEDYAPSLSVLANLMITLSDNVATNQLIDLLGMDRINQFCQENGLVHTQLQRKMLDFEAIRQGRNNYMTAGEAGRLLSLIARGEFLDPDSSRQILSIMEAQQCRNKLPALIPAVPSYAAPEDKQTLKPDTVLVANKTGDLVGIQHDVGVFTLPDGRRYVISVFSGGLEEDAQGIQMIAQISQAVYQAVK